MGRPLSVHNHSYTRIGDSFHSCFPKGAPVYIEETVNGQGFGIAPNIVVMRHLDGITGTHAANVPESEHEVGIFEEPGQSRKMPLHAIVNGELYVLGVVDKDNNYNSMTWVSSQQVQRFRIMRTESVPAGAIMPGWAEIGSSSAQGKIPAPFQFPNISGMKSTWLEWQKDSSSVDSEPDLAVGQNSAGTCGVLGNAINFGPDTRYFSGSGPHPYASSDGHWDWYGPNHFSYWQDCDPDNPVVNESDVQLMYSSAKISSFKPTGTQIQNLRRCVFKGSGNTEVDTDKWGYKHFGLNVFLRTGVEGRQIAFKDYYVAVQSAPGVEDYKQCVMLTDSADLINMTRWRVKKASYWAADGTQVRVNVSNYERERYTHIVVIHDDGVTATARAL